MCHRTDNRGEEDSRRPGSLHHSNGPEARIPSTTAWSASERGHDLPVSRADCGLPHVVHRPTQLGLPTRDRRHVVKTTVTSVQSA